MTTPDVEEVPAPAAKKKAKTEFDWETNDRKGLLFAQIISTGPKAFLTNRANLKANAKTGQKEIQYDKKKVWTNAEDGILTQLKKADEFAGCVW